MEKGKPPYTVGENEYWFSHYGEQYRSSLKRTTATTKKLELPYDPAISFLAISPKKMKTLIQKDICTPMIIAALFTIAKI